MAQIKLNNDFPIDIATAHSRIAKKWKNKATTWAKLVERCSETKRTNESVSEYAKMSREEQSNIKDVGGILRFGLISYEQYSVSKEKTP